MQSWKPKVKKVNFWLTKIRKPEIDLISGMAGSRDSKEDASLFLCLSALLLGSPLPPRRRLLSSTRPFPLRFWIPDECSLPEKGSRHPRPDAWSWEQVGGPVTLALTILGTSPALALRLGQPHPHPVDGVGQGGPPVETRGRAIPGGRRRGAGQADTADVRHRRLPLHRGLGDIASPLKGRGCGSFSQTVPNTANSPPPSLARPMPPSPQEGERDSRARGSLALRCTSSSQVLPRNTPAREGPSEGPERKVRPWPARGVFQVGAHGRVLAGGLVESWAADLICSRVSLPPADQVWGPENG